LQLLSNKLIATKEKLGASQTKERVRSTPRSQVLSKSKLKLFLPKLFNQFLKDRNS
jgi:hypothetical protein